jgi:predicted ATPase
MPRPLAEEILRCIDQAGQLYYRLVLLVGPAGTGKTAALHDIHESTKIPLVNVNLELSRRMLDLTERQRVLQLSDFLQDIVSASSADAILLDNIEMLFDLSLEHDPLRLLQGLSRNKTVVASWCGSVMGGHILYATPGHAEYRRYPVKDFLLVCTEFDR